MNTLRALLYYLVVYTLVIVYGTLGPTLLRLVPFKIRFPIMVSWNRLCVLSLRLICGVKVNVQGQENIPHNDGAFVVLSNHESTFETLVLQTLFNPLCTVLKKELLYIPFFGWGLWAIDPIAINRASPREAMRQLSKDGVKRVKEDKHSLLVFPEGTRNPAKKPEKWTRGGANIAVEAGVPIIPLCHNASDHWPMDRLAKLPGTITFVIGEPIPTEGKTSRELTEQVQSWVTEQREKLAERQA